VEDGRRERGIIRGPASGLELDGGFPNGKTARQIVGLHGANLPLNGKSVR
jgi:hypothetical protein